MESEDTIGRAIIAAKEFAARYSMGLDIRLMCGDYEWRVQFENDLGNWWADGKTMRDAVRYAMRIAELVALPEMNAYLPGV